MSARSLFQQYKHHLLIWGIILIVIVVSLRVGVDEKLVVFITLVLGLFTQVFSGLGALIAAIPLVGPLIIKVLTIPFFWILNGLGYLVGAMAVKKGYTREFTRTRVLTFSLLVGLTIGYILGHLLPLR